VHLRDAEVQIDSLHHPSVRTPLAITLLCDAQLTPVKGGNGLEDRRAVLLRFQQPPVLERGFYFLLYPRPPPTPRDTNTSASLAGGTAGSPLPGNTLGPTIYCLRSVLAKRGAFIS
jgi:hypothetical protein